MEGIAMETDQSISDSNLQEIMQSSALSGGVDINSGMSKLYCILQFKKILIIFFCPVIKLVAILMKRKMPLNFLF